MIDRYTIRDGAGIIRLVVYAWRVGRLGIPRELYVSFWHPPATT